MGEAGLLLPLAADAGLLIPCFEAALVMLLLDVVLDTLPPGEGSLDPFLD